MVFWHAYVARSGGDVVEFRLFMSQAPLLMLLVGYGLAHLPRRWAWAAVATAVLGSAVHGTVGERLQSVVEVRRSWHSFGKLEKVAANGEERWDASDAHGNWITSYSHQRAFRALDNLFAHLGPYPGSVRVGYMASGLAAHSTRLLFTESLGFADSRISKARPGEVLDRQPGLYSPGNHQNASPMLLARLGVNLVPMPVATVPDASPDFNAWRPGWRAVPGIPPRVAWAMACAWVPPHWWRADALPLPADSQLFALQLPDGRHWPILYFNRNATIDAILDAHGIQR